MNRVLKIVLLSLATLVVVIVSAVTFLVATESGTRLVITRLMPGMVKVGAIDGRLTGPLVLEDLRIDTASLSVRVARIELRWHPTGALSGTLLVEQIQADSVAIEMLPRVEETASPTEPFRLPSEVSMPLAINLRSLVVRDLSFQTSPSAEPWRIDSIALAGSASGANFRIERLDVAAPLFDVAAEARVTAEADYPIDASVDLNLRPEGMAPLHSTTRASGTLQSLRIEQAIAAPYNLAAEGSVSNPFDDIRLDLHATLSGVNPAAIKNDLPAARLDVQADAEGTPANLAMQATLDASYQQQQVQVRLDSTLAGDELRIDTLAAALPEHGTRIDGHGRVRLAGDFATEAELSWTGLRWPLAAEPDYRSERGQVTVSGSLDQYTVTTAAGLVLPGDVPMEARVSAAGNREKLDAALEVDVLDGRIDGNAALSWTPSLRATVELEGNDVDPAAFSADWPGQLDFTVRADGSVEQEVMRGRLETLRVTGELRDQPLTLEGEGGYEDGELVVDRLEGELGATGLMAEGRYAETADFEWQVESDDLGEWLPSATGKVTSEGRLTGTPPQVVVDAAVSASKLGYRDHYVEALDLTADVDLTDREPTAIDLRVEGLQSAGLAVEAASLTVDGRLGAHRVAFAADSNKGRADLQLAGDLQEPWGDQRAWQFRLDDATLAYPQLRSWRLAAPAEGRAAAGEVVVSRHCWRSEPAELCLAGQRTKSRLQAEFSLAELGFDYFAALLPSSLVLDGALSGSGEILGEEGEPLQATVDVRTGTGRLAVKAGPPDDDGTTAAPGTLLDLEPSQVSLRLAGNALDAEARLDFVQGYIDLEMGLAANDTPWTERSLDGRLELDVPDIAFAAPFAPDIESLTGSVGGRLIFAGRPERPELSGRIALENAGLTSHAAGIRLTDLRAALEGRGSAGIGVDASMRSGGGSLALSGALGLGGPAAGTAIEITGEDFQLLGNEQARLFVSPDLDVEADAEAVRISGLVRIPRADITPKDRPPSAVTASKDVIVLSGENDDAAVEDPTGRPVHAEVQIVLGDAVRFEGFGLKARFEGDTTVTQEPGQPTSATGEIIIAEGEYRAYGQGLVIESGKILFAGGPVTQPALDVRAVRRPEEDILVGSEVRGTLEAPEFTLFSEPPMSQQEQLSWLVLGRSLEEAPAGESSALAQASLALGVRGGNFLAENIGGNLGVDEFGIQSGSGEAGAASDPSDAALVIGKYLSPKLYLSYGIGLFNPVSVLTMEYEINRRLELVTESSSESTGADLVYSFERGE